MPKHVLTASQRYLNKKPGSESVVPLYATGDAWATGEKVDLTYGNLVWTGTIDARYNGKKIAFVTFKLPAAAVPTVSGFPPPQPDIGITITVDNIPSNAIVEVDLYSE